MKRPSSGRGEYELAGTLGEIGAADLVDMAMILEIPGAAIRPTNVRAVIQGGKLRLRLSSGHQVHLARQIEALTLLPKSTRDESTLRGGGPVLQESRYVMRRINIDSIQASGTDQEQAIRIVIGQCSVTNSRDADNILPIDLRDRIRRLTHIYKSAGDFVAPLDSLLDAHRELLTTSRPVTSTDEALVRDIMAETSIQADSYGLTLPERHDALEVLESMAGFSNTSPDISGLSIPGIPLLPRDVNQMRRMAATRGPAAARFSKQVRSAYNHRCAFCGVRLPRTQAVGHSGVDAAHILPYAAYDLDVPTNGICLCKLHHWAFDAGVLILDYLDDGTYFVRLSEDLEAEYMEDQETLAGLQSCLGAIPPSRLPKDRAMWPSPEFISKLLGDLSAQPESAS